MKDAITQAQKLRETSGDLIKALAILNSELDEKSPHILEALNLIATIHRDLGDLPKSLETYEYALKQAKDKKDIIQQVDLLRSLAFWNLKAGDDSHIRYSKNVLELLPQLPETPEADMVRANTYAALGNIEFETKGDLELALDHYTKGLAIATEISFHQRVITLSGDIANLHIHNKNFDQASELLKSIERWAEAKYVIAVPQILLRQAITYAHYGDNEKARQTAEEALKRAQRYNLSNDIKEAKDFISQIS